MIGILLAAQLAIVAHAPSTVGVCEPLELSVAVSAPGTALPRLSAPSFGPFDVMRASNAPQVERDSRAVPSTLVEYRYVLVASEPGTYTIPPFEARLGSAVEHSAPIHVTVVPGGGNATPVVLTRARIDTGERLNLRAAEPDTVYVGQQANYTVAVFLNSTVRDRLRRNPTFYPPDMQAMLAYDLPGSGAGTRPQGTSSCFDALVYRRALFPLQPGRLVIPPAQLTYSLPVGASFFSREESHELQTDSAIVVAVLPPAAGQPSDYDGAVGRFQVSASLGTNVGRVGDPLTLTARVSGEGNVKLLPPPHLDVPWASAVPSDQRVQVDSTSAHIGGRKEFDWVLTPRIAGELDVPPVRYSYFDPATRRYETARSNPIRVRVLPGALANADTSKGEAPLPVRTIYTGPGHAPLSSHPVFWLVLALAPLPALRARWRSRRPRGRRSKSVHARLGDAARVGFADQDGRSLRREFVRALGERLAVDAEAFSTPGALRTALRRAGVQATTANAAEALLRRLDAAAFAPDGQLDEGDGPAALALMAQIDAEALPRRELPFRAGVLIVLMAIGVAGSLRAVQQVQPADLFANGVVAYQEHNYAGARDAFARVTAVAPRSPDAWVNYGTAAWALRDTVDAVVGWRHGLGLQPLAGDARSRLGLVHGVRPLSPGYAPPVPVNALLLLMSLCWLSACAAWHPALRRRARWTGAWPVPLIVAAVAIGLVAVADGDALSGRGAAVVRASTSLHDDPALGADQGPVVVIGEMVRVLSQSGAWDRVELDGGRQGWLPAQGLVPLDAPAPPPLD